MNQTDTRPTSPTVAKSIQGGMVRQAGQSPERELEEEEKKAETDDDADDDNSSISDKNIEINDDDSAGRDSVVDDIPLEDSPVDMTGAADAHLMAENQTEDEPRSQRGQADASLSLMDLYELLAHRYGLGGSLDLKTDRLTSLILDFTLVEMSRMKEIRNNAISRPAVEFMYGCLVLQLICLQEFNLDIVSDKKVPELFLRLMVLQAQETIGQHAVLAAFNICLLRPEFALKLAQCEDCAATLVDVLDRGLRASANWYYDDLEELICPRLRLIELTSLAAPYLFKNTSVSHSLMTTWINYELYWNGKELGKSPDDLRKACRKDELGKEAINRKKIQKKKDPLDDNNNHQEETSSPTFLSADVTTNINSDIANIISVTPRSSLPETPTPLLNSSIVILTEVSPLERRRAIRKFKQTESTTQSRNLSSQLLKQTSLLMANKETNKTAGKFGIRGRVLPSRRTEDCRLFEPSYSQALSVETTSSPRRSLPTRQRIKMEARWRQAKTSDIMKDAIDSLLNVTLPDLRSCWKRIAIRLNENSESTSMDIWLSEGFKSKTPRRQEKYKLTSLAGPVFKPFEWRFGVNDPMTYAQTETYDFVPLTLDILFRVWRYNLHSCKDFVPRVTAKGQVDFLSKLVIYLCDPETPPAALSNILFLIGYVFDKRIPLPDKDEHQTLERIYNLLKRAHCVSGLYVSQVVANSCLCLASFTHKSKHCLTKFNFLNGIDLLVSVLSSRTILGDEQAIDGVSTCLSLMCYHYPPMRKSLGAAGAPDALLEVLRVYCEKGSDWNLSIVCSAIECLAARPDNITKFVDAGLESVFVSILKLQPTIDQDFRSPQEMVLRIMSTLNVSGINLDCFSNLCETVTSGLSGPLTKRFDFCLFAFLALNKICEKCLPNQKTFIINKGAESVMSILIANNNSCNPIGSNSKSPLSPLNKLRASGFNLLEFSGKQPGMAEIIINRGIFMLIYDALSEFTSKFSNYQTLLAEQSDYVVRTLVSLSNQPFHMTSSMTTDDFGTTTNQSPANNSQMETITELEKLSLTSMTDSMPRDSAQPSKLDDRTIFSENNRSGGKERTQMSTQDIAWLESEVKDLTYLATSALKCSISLVYDTVTAQTCLASQVFARITEMLAYDTSLPLVVLFYAFRLFWLVIYSDSEINGKEDTEEIVGSKIFNDKTVREILSTNPSHQLHLSTSKSFSPKESSSRIHSRLNYRDSLPAIVFNVRNALSSRKASGNLKFTRMGIGILAYCAAEKEAVPFLFKSNPCLDGPQDSPFRNSNSSQSPKLLSPPSATHESNRLMSMSSMLKKNKPSINKIMFVCFEHFWTDSKLMEECCQLLNNLIFLAIGVPEYTAVLLDGRLVTAIQGALKMRNKNKTQILDARLSARTKALKSQLSRLDSLLKKTDKVDQTAEASLLMLMYKTWANFEVFNWTDGMIPPDSIYNLIPQPLNEWDEFFAKYFKKFTTSGTLKSFVSHFSALLTQPKITVSLSIDPDTSTPCSKIVTTPRPTGDPKKFVIDQISHEDISKSSSRSRDEDDSTTCDDSSSNSPSPIFVVPPQDTMTSPKKSKNNYLFPLNAFVDLWRPAQPSSPVSSRRTTSNTSSLTSQASKVSSPATPSALLHHSPELAAQTILFARRLAEDTFATHLTGFDDTNDN